MKLVIFFLIVFVFISCREKQLDFNRMELITYTLDLDHTSNRKGKPIFYDILYASIDNKGYCQTEINLPNSLASIKYTHFTIDKINLKKLLKDIEKIKKDTICFNYDSTIMESKKFFKIKLYKENKTITIRLCDNNDNPFPSINQFYHQLDSLTRKNKNYSYQEENCNKVMIQSENLLDQETESFPNNYIERFIIKRIPFE